MINTERQNEGRPKNSLFGQDFWILSFGLT